MATDNDLAALLPDAPPPRPARREAAIDLAMRRFDGLADQVPAGPVRARPAPALEGWGRSQLAAFASVALVVVVSVPIWWAERDRVGPSVPESVPPAAEEGQPSAGPSPVQRVSPQSAAPDAGLTSAEPGSQASPPASTPLPSIAEAAEREASPRPPPPPPQRQQAVTAARSAAPADADRTIVVTGSRVTRSDFTSNSPMVSVDEEFLDNRAESDPNACTLLDPRRDLSACHAFADPAAGGGTRRAAARLADGLDLGWQGELDPAIDAFDRAIRAEPDLSVAYLNRGLAYRAKGNLRRALADLNRAVSRDPENARGYYHRSQLHRARGDTARAEADAERAVELDPGYEALLP